MLPLVYRHSIEVVAGGSPVGSVMADDILTLLAFTLSKFPPSLLSVSFDASTNIALTNPASPIPSALIASKLLIFNALTLVGWAVPSTIVMAYCTPLSSM